MKTENMKKPTKNAKKKSGKATDARASGKNAAKNLPGKGLKNLSRAAAIAAIKTVSDPEIGIDLWTLGLIYKIDIRQGGSIFIKMTFTTPTCPYAPMLVEQVKDALKKKGFKRPNVEFVFDPPWEPSEEVRMMLGMA